MAEGFAVADDLVRRFDPTLSGIERSLSESLSRLNLDRVDTVLLHDPDAYDLDDGLRLGLPALASLRSAGLADEVGVGVNSVHAAVGAIAEGDIDVVMIAGRYTLLEQSAAEALLPLAADRGVRVIAAAVFNSGLLAAKVPHQAHYNYSTVPDAIAEKSRRLQELCTVFGVPMTAAALQFPLRHRAVDSVVVGTARASAIRENIESLRVTIPDEFWDALSALA